MNRIALTERIRTLTGLTDNERADLLTLLAEQKTYGLIWEDKLEQVEEDLRASLPVLREITDRRIYAASDATEGNSVNKRMRDTTDIESIPTDGQLTLNLSATESEPVNNTLPPTEITVDLENQHNENQGNQTNQKNHSSDAPHHLLIEGDNLHALTVLNYTHAGQVDVIYIDPPYNTGNKDFKYNDRFVDREDSYRHSKWLSFMHKRLTLARTLLKPEGVIFISIDDNEQAQLKLICDQVFGEANFVANVIWQKKYAPKSDSKYFSESHDFIVVYAKVVDKFSINHLPKTDKQNDRYVNKDKDPRGPWKASDVLRNEFREYAYFPVTLPSGRQVYPPSGTSWRYTKEKFAELINDNRIWFGEDGDKRPAYKRFLSEVRDTIPSTTLWTYDEVGHNDAAKKEIRDVLGEDIFSTPKPSTLLKRIVQIATKPNALVLDFFAGSGTTLHAVMALNAEDGGNRQCILVTNNENNIAEEVCYERNRRVIEGYTNSKGVAVPGLTANHLHYYQTAYVGRERTLANKRTLMQMATELIQIKERCFSSAEKGGKDEGEQGKTIRLFTNDRTGMPDHGMPDHDRYVVVIYDEDAIDEAVTLIQALPATVARVKVYVFAPGFYPYTDDFADVADRIELTALPEAIYQAYGRLLPPAGTPAHIADDTETAVPEIPISLFSTPA